MAKVYDASTWQCVAEISQGFSNKSAKFSANGRYLATIAAGSCLAKILTLETGQIATIEHCDEINDVQFSPDNKYVATASLDGTAKVFSVETDSVITTIKHYGPVRSVRWSHDSRYIVTSSADKTAKIFDLITKQNIATIRHGFWLNSEDVRWIDLAQFTPDGTHILTTSFNCVTCLFARGLEVRSPEQAVAIASIVWMALKMRSNDQQPAVSLNKTGWLYKIFMQIPARSRKKLLQQFPEIAIMLVRATGGGNCIVL